MTIVETTQEALDKGVARIKDTLRANVKRGRITEAQAKPSAWPGSRRR